MWFCLSIGKGESQISSQVCGRCFASYREEGQRERKGKGEGKGERERKGTKGGTGKRERIKVIKQQ